MNPREVHFDAIVVDAHADTIDRELDKGEDLTLRAPRGHIDLARMDEGGLDAQFFSCFVHPRFVEKGEGIKRALRMIDAVKRLAARSNGRLVLAGTASDVRRIVGEGRKAGILCIEGGHAIDDDLGVLRLYHELGVRYMTLTWNNTNNWADGCGGPIRHDGLTDFGRDVVREMNRIGMIVDISHVAEKTFYDALETTTKPPICSHSCCKAICNHRRNVTDDQLRALAKKGGVCCVNFYSAFLSEEFRVLAQKIEMDREAENAEAKGDDRRLAEIHAKYEAIEASRPQPPFEILLQHIDRMVEIAGVDHVGLGSDFDGVSSLPRGVEDATKLPRVTEALFERGYSEADVRKILGENLLRVLQAVAGG